jgi:hypothetical protein
MEATVAAQLTHANVEAAARSVDISVATLMRWQKEPEFQKALQQARRAAFGQAIARLRQMSGAAVATLGKMMVDQTAPPSPGFGPLKSSSTKLPKRPNSKISKLGSRNWSAPPRHRNREGGGSTVRQFTCLVL